MKRNLYKKNIVHEKRQIFNIFRSFLLDQKRLKLLSEVRTFVFSTKTISLLVIVTCADKDALETKQCLVWRKAI